jgi:acyl carrier protein
MSTLYDPVKAKVAQHFNIPEESITPDSTFEDLGLDSIGIVELLCVLQDDLGLRIPSSEALRADGTTFAQAVAAVEAAQHDSASTA